MSFDSTLDQARYLLPGLSPASSAADVLQAARAREAELVAKSSDPKATAIGRQGAAKQLKILAPLLPVLEIEADLAALETASSSAVIGPQIHKLRLDEKHLAERVAALPAGDERTILTERLRAVHQTLHPSEADPALAAFAAKLAELRAAIDQKESGRPRLGALLAEARGVASVLRDETARQQATAQLNDFARLVEALATPPPPPRPPSPPPPPEVDPTAKIIAEKISQLQVAVEKKNQSRAPVLLEAARDLASLLRSPAARRQAEADLAALAAAVDQLFAPPPPDPAEARSAEKIGAMRTALASGDLASIPTLLAEATSVVAAIVSVAARTKLEVELAECAAHAARLTAAALLRVRQGALAQIFAAARLALSRTDLPAAKSGVAEARVLAAELSDSAARDKALAEISRLAAEVDATVVPQPAAPDPGLVLRLVPQAGGAATAQMTPPLRIVARPRFLLGKELLQSASLADFLAPNSFGPVGRVQAVLTLRDDEILIQDGNGEKKSVNGTKLDDEALPAAPVPASFAHDRTLLLATVFSLTARHLPGDAPAGPPLGSAIKVSVNRTVQVRNLTGAMRFAPTGGLPLPVVALWLFTDATIGTAPACAVCLPATGLAEMHARVHHWQGGFWIENLRSGPGVGLGDRALPKGEAVPLHQGDVLKLGNVAYDVHLEN
jgi:hypothetical protein